MKMRTFLLNSFLAGSFPADWDCTTVQSLIRENYRPDLAMDALTAVYGTLLNSMIVLIVYSTMGKIHTKQGAR